MFTNKSTSSVQPALVSRTSIFILASVLFSMGLGGRIPPLLADRCIVFGAFGFISYVVLELAASHWGRRKQRLLKQVADRVLERRLKRLSLTGSDSGTALE